MTVCRGTTRTVILTQQWVFKFPWGLCRAPVRGWLANRSEWRQRHRPDVVAPKATVGHFVLVMPRARLVGSAPTSGNGFVARFAATGLNADERKASSWGRHDGGWLLVDYDRSWKSRDRGLIGRLYWGNQERLARKWAKL